MREQLDIELVRIGSAGAKAMAVVRGDVDAYVHAGGQWEWDSAAPAGVVRAAGMHASRLDGSPMIYNRPDPYLPDLLMCRPELADVLLEAILSASTTAERMRERCSRRTLSHTAMSRVDAMQSWSAPTVPELPGRGPQLRLYDSADRQVRPVSPGETATMYVCGITPYDATHLGHAATYLAFDLVHRLWLDAGHDVHYVQNITDVDDPLFERAARDGIDWRDSAPGRPQLFREDMAALRVLPPHDYVAATEAIAEVIELVEKLLASGAAYVVDDAEYPDVYFRADATVQFGYESGYDRETMLQLFAERGGDPDRAGQGRPLDALLWRAERPGEPSWPSPFGPGRPGWHVECAAIALTRIGTGLDIQGGGSDLIFPHHEFSAAHAESVTGERRFARHYVHAGMIGWDGHKMSKSRGNLVLVSQLRARGRRPGGDPARAVRRALPRRPVLEPAGARRGAGPAGPLAYARRRCRRRPTPTTSSPGCASTWPTISTRRKRLLPLMVGPPMRWPTAAMTQPPARRWRPQSTRCSELQL